MKWVILIVRTLVGLLFLWASGAYFLNMMPDQEAPPENVKAFMGVMIPTGYMTAVKVFELVGGLLLLSGFLVPVGITLLTPVIVNILIYDFAIMRKPGLGIVLVLASAFLIYGYWPYFRSVFTVRARIGGDRV